MHFVYFCCTGDKIILNSPSIIFILHVGSFFLFFRYFVYLNTPSIVSMLWVYIHVITMNLIKLSPIHCRFLLVLQCPVDHVYLISQCQNILINLDIYLVAMTKKWYRVYSKAAELNKSWGKHFVDDWEERLLLDTTLLLDPPPPSVAGCWRNNRRDTKRKINELNERKLKGVLFVWHTNVAAVNTEIKTGNEEC